MNALPMPAFGRTRPCVRRIEARFLLTCAIASQHVEHEGASMIEFAVGIMVGGSIGAVIMGALLAQTRTTIDRHEGAHLQARAPMQALQHSAPRAPRRTSVSRPIRVRTRPTLATASALLH